MAKTQYYSSGKLLLTGEYGVLDGAEGLALPTKLGQTLEVSAKPSYNPSLTWSSYDLTGKLWATAKFEFWHFDLLEGNDHPDVYLIQNILRQARKQNVHFLREEMEVIVSTRLEFPRSWGLGSSSSLISNIARWAYVAPFELAKVTLGGSGYDLACAQSSGPILFKREGETPTWSTVNFSPKFLDNLYLVYQGKKKNSRQAIEHYNKVSPILRKHLVSRLSGLTKKIVEATELEAFESILLEHELLLSEALELPRIKELLFDDYWGEVKSLGAWGGDMALATSDRSRQETEEYFQMKGHWVVFPLESLVFTSKQTEAIDTDFQMNHYFSL